MRQSERQRGFRKRAERAILPNVQVYEKFRRLPYYSIIKVGEIWVKEKVQPLKIIYALFLEPHTLC